MTEANLHGLSTSLTNRSTVFIVWQGLYTILGKTSYTLIYLCLVLSATFISSGVDKVCKQFKEKLAVHLPR